MGMLIRLMVMIISGISKHQVIHLNICNFHFSIIAPFPKMERKKKTKKLQR